ncbi:hypothetical protein GQ54DRAFT_297667 [Martensiomyces pterosporus]|nr:hypothetical protein GQ54DRAFT_297667 [Martensiomyces pterosporus]
MGSSWTLQRAVVSGQQCRHIHVERVETDAGAEDLKSGSAKYRAGLYINRVFPLKVSVIDIRPYLVSRNLDMMRRKVETLVPTDLPHGFALDRIEPHKRDGGSVVYFTFTTSGSHEDAKAVAMQIVRAVDGHLSAGRAHRWHSLWPARSLPVKGVPFNEDIVRLLPSKKIKVEFNGPDLTVEQLYNEFREYGLILDIEPQPSSVKDTPRWAVVSYTKLRSATSARNCVHGDVVGSTKLSLSFVQMRHESVVFQWFRAHTKFTIPLAAAALIAAIYAVFDPIREFFVENKITHRFDLSRLPLIGSMRKAVLRSFLWRGAAAKDSVSTWSGLFEQEERLVSILNEPPESFVVVSGPHGSGKTSLVEKATRGKKYRIVIDASKLGSQHSEMEQMIMLAKQLGYWPVFSSIISITNAVDLMVTATTGSKAGISATPQSQVRKILECLAFTLTKIRHDQTRRILNQGEQSKSGQHEGYPYPGEAFGDSDRLSAGTQLLPPDEIPVIVLENFKDKDMPFDSAILEWSASMVESGLAHVVVTTRSIGGYRDIQRAQPQRAVSLLSLDDASPMGAVAMLQRQLQPTMPPAPDPDDSDKEADAGRMAEYQRRLDMVQSDQIAYAASILGGRLEDLQLFVQKVKAGESIDGSLEDIIQRAITEIRKYAFADDAEIGQHEHTWSPEQFWYLLTELAGKGSVQYDRMRNSPLFVSNDSALLGLEEAQLISMQYDNDRPSRIKPGRPIFQTAFRRILEDPGFSSSMTMKMNRKFIELETAKIRKAEEELALLNVFRASADSYNTLTSGIAMIAASRDASGGGRGGSSSGDRRWSRHSASREQDGAANDSYNPEAFIAKAVRNSNGQPTPSAADSTEPGAATRNTASQPASSKQAPSSWFGWLFGRSASPSEKHHLSGDAQTSQNSLGVSNGDQGSFVPTVIPGVPRELQGRVQFLLKAIHDSQNKINRWQADNTVEAKQLSAL